VAAAHGGEAELLRRLHREVVRRLPHARVVSLDGGEPLDAQDLVQRGGREVAVVRTGRHHDRAEREDLREGLRGAPGLLAVAPPELHRLGDLVRPGEEAEELPLVGRQLQADEDAQGRLRLEVEELVAPVLGVGLGEGHPFEAERGSPLEDGAGVEVAPLGEVRMNVKVDQHESGGPAASTDSPPGSRAEEGRGGRRDWRPASGGSKPEPLRSSSWVRMRYPISISEEPFWSTRSGSRAIKVALYDMKNCARSSPASRLIMAWSCLGSMRWIS